MSKQDAEAKLEQLNQRLEAGWNNLHSIKESQLEALRDVVREQWQTEQKQFAEQEKQGGQKSQDKKKSASKKQDKVKRLSQKKNRGHSQ